MSELLERPRHDEDFYAWAIDQAQRLRAVAAERRNEPIDWEELAEELEFVARRDYRAASSFFTHILQHLLKVEYSRQTEPLRQWCRAVRQFRRNFKTVTTTSVENRLRASLAEQYGLGVDLAEATMLDDPDILDLAPATCPYSYEQIVGDWWPERVQDIVATFGRR